MSFTEIIITQNLSKISILRWVKKDHIFLTFPSKYSLGVLICYRVHFSVQETVERICVAICLRLTQKIS